MTRLRLINAVLFQFGWAGAVVVGQLAGSLMALAALAAHLLPPLRQAVHWPTVALVAGIGILVDSLWMHMGLLGFPQHDSWLVPAWLCLVWLLFATTLNLSLAWLGRRLWLAALFGALGAALSYGAGQRLQVLTFAAIDPGLSAPSGMAGADQPLPWTTLSLYACGWALALPGFFQLSRYLART